MTGLTDVIMESASGSGKDPKFPYAPADWAREAALKMAQQAGLKLGDDHWEAVNALQEYYARHDQIFINTRNLHDALDERFHGKGGMKYLYQLFPAGPVAQGCRIAGLKAPANAIDKGFGSVV
jgi:tRNA 2-thiouridine synthesizing protein E